MNKQFLSFLFIFLVAICVSAQTDKARNIDEFGRLPCGDFLARMDNIFIESQNSPDSKIYVVYYGGRYRKKNIWNKKTKELNVKLEYPHPEDGLNYAKSIPLYLTSELKALTRTYKLSKDKFILVNGGFRENIEVEIWFVPKDAESPKPIPTITEKDIKFRKDKPLKIPRYSTCYE